MNRNRLMVVMVAALGVASVVVMWSAGASAGAEQATAPVAAADGRVVAGPGRVEPVSEEIDVSGELPGRIVEVLVDEGDAVTSGQVLARLESRDYAARVASAEARLAAAEAERLRLVNGARTEERREAAAVAAQAEAALEHARLEVERHRRLFEEGVIARDAWERAERDWRVATARRTETVERAATVDADARADELARADANVALARASLAEARAMLQKTEVRSPLDGVVLRGHRQAGESVSLERPSPIVTVADTRVLRVRVEVDEKDVAALALGRPAWVTAAAYGDTRFTGRVVRIGQMLGRKEIRTDAPTERVDTKVLEVLVELDAGQTLPVGLRVDAFIQ
ncbi:MAG: HlyD family secretion protein, partial [Vicinamibacteria bacterium]